MDGAALDLSSSPNQSINQINQSDSSHDSQRVGPLPPSVSELGGSPAAAVVALEAILQRRGVDLARIGARRTPLLERLGEPRTAREATLGRERVRVARRAGRARGLGRFGATSRRRRDDEAHREVAPTTLLGMLQHLLRLGLMFTEQQFSALGDYIRVALFLKYNKRTVG